MFSALFYLQATTLRNQLGVRLRRLRQPRYLVGALVGGLYLASVFSRGFLAFGGRAPSASSLPVSPLVWELLAGLALFVVLLLTWVLPSQRAALIFSEAEIAFLFPAPVRRATLIRYKLFKSQFGVLFTVLFLTVISPRPGGWSSAVMRATGWWILLSTLQLHILGASFARTILLERGFSHWQRRLAATATAVAIIGATVFWAARELPTPQPPDVESWATLQDYLQHAAVSAPAIWLLGPFRAVARPFLAREFPAFLAALGPALLILVLHYFWVVRSNAAFEEASVEASQRQAVRLAEAGKTGQRTRRLAPWRKRRDPFPLRPLGTPAVAIFWKNLLAAGQLFSIRAWFGFLVWAVVVGYSLGHGAGKTGWPEIVGMIAGMLVGWSVLLGPQIVRYDFRHDLAAADLLKSYPMKGWQVALGEILAPAMILTAAQWLLLTLIGVTRLAGKGLLSAVAVPDGTTGTTVLALLSLPLAAAVVLPTLDLLSLLIPNAAALLLPGWFAGSGNAGGSRGIEVMGQRLIFVLGQTFVLLVSIIPAALAGFLAKVFLADPYLGEHWSLPATALVASVVLGAEFCFGLAALGHWFDHYDLSGEQAG